MCRTQHKVKDNSRVSLSTFVLCFMVTFWSTDAVGAGKCSHFKMMVQVTVHAMAVKYGGKFVDSFLKGIGVTLLIYYDLKVDSLGTEIRMLSSFWLLTGPLQHVQWAYTPIGRICTKSFLAWLIASRHSKDLSPIFYFIFWIRWESFKRPQEQYKPYVLKQRFN